MEVGERGIPCSNEFENSEFKTKLKKFFLKLRNFLEPVLCNVHCDSHNGNICLQRFPFLKKHFSGTAVLWARL